MYKLTNTTSIIRTSDNALIPTDEVNTDYQQYLQWVSEGNEPEGADPVAVDELDTTDYGALIAAQASKIDTLQTQLNGLLSVFKTLNG